MTDEEARKLATRIIDSWPNGPKAYIWRDNLAPLDAIDAASAYRTLVAESDKPPTIAQFLAVYHAKRRSHVNSSYTPTDTGPVISFGEYMNRLIARSQRGDTDAAEEIQRWERFYGKGKTA